MLRRFAPLAFAFLSLFASACRSTPPPPKDFARELAPGRMALEPVADPSSIPFDLGMTEKETMLASIEASLSYLKRPSAAKYFPYKDAEFGYSITLERAVRSLERFKAICQETATGADLKKRILGEFQVFRSVGWNGQGGVLFTAYYTGTFDGSREKTDVFRFPLYRRPPDLATTPEGVVLGRKTPEGGTAPYYTRQEIEGGALAGKGLEICWMKDPFDAYVAQIQGHADIRLPDGSILKIGNAGTNGAEYKSIRNLLMSQGKLAPEKASLGGLEEYFRAHPEEIKVFSENPRYPFFAERAGDPVGSLNVPVTARRSIATDKAVFPRGCLAFCDARVPEPGESSAGANNFRQFVCDQDTGGAIRAAGRADIYIGRGPLAKRIAGRTESEGFLYYIFLKELAPSVPPPSPAPEPPAP
ncbi:MAG: MltA domain-containing protein [Planctomycetota bacterium]